jgi:hypothetical protein
LTRDCGFCTTSSICIDGIAGDLSGDEVTPLCNAAMAPCVDKESGPMHVAFVSDIHGNLPALEAVVRDLRALDVTVVVNLGDCRSARGCCRSRRPDARSEAVGPVWTVTTNARSSVMGVPAAPVESVRAEPGWAHARRTGTMPSP